MELLTLTRFVPAFSAGHPTKDAEGGQIRRKNLRRMPFFSPDQSELRILKQL